jgi:cobalt-zinc-cadmium efflux system outer membrane protein
MKPNTAFRWLAGISVLSLLSFNRVVAGTMPTNDPGAPLSTWVVTNSFPATNEITFKGFLNEVAEANLDYAAQRYNVDISKAAIAIAREFPNPTLNLGDNHELRFQGKEVNGVSQGEPEAYSIGVAQTVLLGGKRKWGIRVATQNYHAAAATLDDFLRNLKLDASGAFITALAAQRALEQQRKTTDYLNQLVAVQNHRFQAGDIGETDLTQSRVDELQSESDLLNAENDAQVAQRALNNFLGRNRGQTLFILRGKLEYEKRNFDLNHLIAEALQIRPDLVALRHTRDSTQSGVRLAKANRVPDVTAGVNYTYSTATENFVNPTPSLDYVGVSLSFPLPLWNRNKGEIATARLLTEQSQKLLESAELKAEVQVQTAFTTYEYMQDRVKKFEGDLLKGADDVLAAKRYSYEHGNSTLDDLIMAQNADNDIHQNYNDALADAAKALIELERAAGLWDITF